MRSDKGMNEIIMKEAQNVKKIENRREDKKAFGKMMLFVIAGAVVGFFMGFFSVFSEGMMSMIAEKCMQVVTVIAPYGNFFFSTIMIIAYMVWMRKGRKLYEAWDGEDEDVIEKVESKIEKALALTSVNMIFVFFFFGLGVYVSEYGKLARNESLICIAINMLGLIYGMIVTVVLQKNLVNFTKEINPEKHGSVYDTGFQKKWLESCDESEQLQTYRAGYCAMQTGSFACIVLWVVCMIGMLSWDFGIMPMVMVLAIWLVMIIRYYIEAMKISNNHGNISQKTAD